MMEDNVIRIDEYRKNYENAYIDGYHAAIREIRETKNRRKVEKRQKFLQKLAGIGCIAAGLSSYWWCDYDMTAAFLLVPLGLMLICTKENMFRREN